MNGGGGEGLNCSKGDQSHLGRRSRKWILDIKYQQCWLGKAHHKVSEFKRRGLPVKSFSDSLGTWSLSVYLSVRLRDKPGVILISSLSPSPSPGPG